MDDRPDTGADRVMSVWLDLHLDRQPVSGRLRAEHGAEERFVGWLGFVDALRRLRDSTCPSDADWPQGPG
jgi:hypothetical protein